MAEHRKIGSILNAIIFLEALFYFLSRAGAETMQALRAALASRN